MKKVIVMMLLAILTIGASQPSIAQSKARTKARTTRTTTHKKTTPAPLKNCNVTGAIRYHFNDYQGYKPDLGAEIRFVPVQAVDSVHLKEWRTFESKAHSIIMAKISIQNLENDGIYMDSSKRSLFYGNYGVSESDEAKMMKLNTEILYPEYQKLENAAEYIALIDANGTYNLTLPRGKYYVLMKSKSRTRSSYLTDITGCVHVEEVDLSLPTKILSYDFDY